MNYEALPGMEDALKLVQEKKMSKEAHKKAAKAGKRWQDSDGDGKWYEKGEDVKEGVRDTDPEKGTAERKARLEKKRGMKVDDHPQYKKEEVEEVEEAEQRVKAKADKKMKVYGGPAYIKKPKNEEVEQVDEDDKSYDRNRKRAAQRAADRNAARAAGKTGVVPGVGYVTARKEKESYTDSKGVERHKSGAKNEEVEIEEGMKAARDNVGASTCWKGYKAKGTKKKNGKEVPNCVPANEELEVMEGSLMESGLFTDDEVRYIIGEKFDELEELYKGKHGQSEKQYQDGRSDAGKMVSGDSKMSGSKFAQGRRTGSDAGAQPAGGSKKPASQGKMDSGSRTDLQFRKAALKKKAGK
jgi:hypothetical protein